MLDLVAHRGDVTLELDDTGSLLTGNFGRRRWRRLEEVFQRCLGRLRLADAGLLTLSILGELLFEFLR